MTQAPRLYCADLRTGEYLPAIEVFADPDPLDPENWLVPAGAYLEPPPVATAQQAVLRGDAGWYIVEDHRGRYYRTDTCAAEQLVVFGPLPDYLTDAPPPSDAHIWRDGAWVFDKAKHAELLAGQCQALCAAIDAAADAARQAVAGDPLRAVEYDRARLEAEAFAAADYLGEVPPMVAAWAINGRTPQEAADDILHEAAQYTAALIALRETRLAAKEKVRALLAVGEGEQAQQVVERTIAAIDAAVAGVGNTTS